MTVATLAPAIAARGVSVQFGGVAAVREVDLAVAPGTVHALIGPNGAGKTTLLNTFNRFVDPDRGAIFVGEHEVTTVQPHAIVDHGVARSFQAPVLIDEMSAVENVEFGVFHRCRTTLWRDLAVSRPSRRVRRERRERAMSALASLGMEGVAHRSAGELSFGNRKLLDLARALSVEPSVLLLDEPTAGLDLGRVDMLTDFLAAAKRTMAVLVVEHHIEFVVAVADRVSVLSSGQRIAEGTPGEVRSDPVVIDAYMGSGE